MKKWILICILILGITSCFFACKNTNSTYEEYFYKINALIKNENFNTADIKENYIILYDSKDDLIKEIPFEYYNNDIELVNVYKNDEIIYFVTGGSVDDEKGILFINDDSNKMFDGIKSLHRIGGNSYSYSTN